VLNGHGLAETASRQRGFFLSVGHIDAMGLPKGTDEMAKYLLRGGYTLEGVRGLLKTGGSARRDHFSQNVANLGGRVEAFYFAFGGEDIFAAVDLPDSVSAAALPLALGTGGGFQSHMTVLITPEEVDKAAQRVPSVGYQPPGAQAR